MLRAKKLGQLFRTKWKKSAERAFYKESINYPASRAYLRPGHRRGHSARSRNRLEAVVGALRTKLLQVLIIDEQTAQKADLTRIKRPSPTVSTETISWGAPFLPADRGGAEGGAWQLAHPREIFRPFCNLP
jgi:hypothetical protein